MHREHWIREGKKYFPVPEYGETAVGMMRTLKHAFDPDNIMNPSKIVRRSGFDRCDRDGNLTGAARPGIPARLLRTNLHTPVSRHTAEGGYVGLSSWIAHKSVWSPQNVAVRLGARDITYAAFEQRIAHLAGYLVDR